MYDLQTDAVDCDHDPTSCLPDHVADGTMVPQAPQ